jgi:hypothetical protein
MQNWKQSKRLMNGNMILLSDDGFQNSNIQCVIRNRDGTKMEYTATKYGYIEIDVEIIIDPDYP